MTGAQLHTLARGWLEYEGLDHLLPDPHGHEHIRGLVATFYRGGLRQFATDVEHLAMASPAPSTSLVSAIADTTWFNPPESPITKICERDWCRVEFRTKKPHKRFCSLQCQEGWRPFDQQTIDRVLQGAA